MFYNEAVMSMRGVPTVSDICIFFVTNSYLPLINDTTIQSDHAVSYNCPCGPVVIFSSLWQVDPWSEST